MRTHRLAVASLAGMLALSALGSARAQSSGTPDTAARKDIRTWSVFRYLSTTRGQRLDGIEPQDLVDLYTSAQISSSDACGVIGPNDARKHDDADKGDDCLDNQPVIRRYSLEHRSWWARIFSDRKLFIGGSAHILVTNPTLDVTRPLFTIEHDTTRGSPDTFVTEFSASDAQAPLFRIEANTTITVSIGQKVSEETTVTGAASVISAVQVATRIAAPSTSILTTKSSADIANVSKAIDSTIGSLISTNKTETINLGNRFVNWNKDDEYSIIARVPNADVKIGESSTAPPSTDDRDAATMIGHWYVWLSCPQPSAFSARDICVAAPKSGHGYPLRIIEDTSIADTVRKVETQIFADLQDHPGTVLDAHMSSQVTVRDFVKTSDWYTNFFQARTHEGADTAKFCVSAIDGLHTAGLSQFDARLVVWAMSQALPGMVGLDAEKAGTGIGENCSALVGGIITFPPTARSKSASSSGNKASPPVAKTHGHSGRRSRHAGR